ncbi:MAG: hypothetical protein OER95_10730 [Acidimicrobiia bacterium]|nr:hypothetical protein [Acidimicrobiia bacterium]
MSDIEQRRVAGFRLSQSIGLIVALSGFVVGARIIADNSLLTHLATGDLIVATAEVPDVDPYSRQFAGEPWTVQSWLASLVYSWTVRLAGTPGLRLVHGLAAWAVMAGCWRLTSPANQLAVRTGLTVFPLAIGATFWAPRPFMFALLGLVVVLLVLRGFARPWVLLPTMWMWVNSHGSFPLAVVLLGAVIVGSLIDHRRVPRRELAILAWTAAGIGVGGVNPVGLRLWWFPFQLLGRGEALERVVEWEPPNFERPAEYLYLVGALIIVIAARRRLPWADLLPALAFFAGGLLAIRNIVPASVVIVVMVAPALAGLIGAETGERRGVLARGGSLAALAGLLAAGFSVLVSPGLTLERYPVNAVGYLEDHGLVANDEVVVVHREGVGNYLTYRFGSRARVFIDDRFDFYPVSQTSDHVELLYGVDYDEVLDRHQADVVLWQTESGLADWLAETPDWSLAYTDEDWLVACRRSSPVIDRCVAAGGD